MTDELDTETKLERLRGRLLAQGNVIALIAALLDQTHPGSVLALRRVLSATDDPIVPTDVHDLSADARDAAAHELERLLRSIESTRNAFDNPENSGG